MDEYRDRRTSVTSFKRNSIDSTGGSSNGSSRRNSQEQTRRASFARPEQHTSDQNTEAILILESAPNSYVESKFCRTGSIQYRNAGWLSSRIRSDSSSSNNSNTSGKQTKASNTALQLPAEERKVYIQQKFIEIAGILKDSGVDEEILHRIRS